MEELDQMQINFGEDSLFLMNLSLAVIMFGVALEIKLTDFKYLWSHPKSFILGITSQFLLLPFLTWVLILLIQPSPSVALGMFLVAACPGGNISNFLTNYARGNSALSVSLTAFATLSSIVLTPFNFALWSGLYSPSALLLKSISLNYSDVFETVALILGIPLMLGIYVNKRKPFLAEKMASLLKPISVVIFISIVIIAFYSNFDLFIRVIGWVFGLVLMHNLVALGSGFSLSKIFGLNLEDTKTLTIETGIQNSGLALVLIFNYFDGLGGMSIIAGWWGIWHIVSGLTIASLWKKYNYVAKVV
ncbi:bile acid:sodium symporter family protein [Cyclobacterium marinum]|uniref:Bile acid:sodium symporter n=1 Tax=Cyclobacterium marinum (strain ATCC 25205 / DSM 745 / LMG 13164 / NCIMB 1802) TaxID=880070 RepID=G0J347_CYCMS|nr:bile acid:sodium symporter family protein [Cyclobacterium marinum]AEL28343.1 Bile acid:sodium symporter [Cyclobacterium marinum DSM 745]MBI0398198.1 bile acid:sodium symporter family protein [Cyclobacterium marinum]MBR9777148.1 bile acid:sodium symporter family protein [Cytophagales bacterium]|tara:strand:- start:9728 stop:10639 length:912 start_codon:yes stop_codon:yes gene_type:complete